MDDIEQSAGSANGATADRDSAEEVATPDAPKPTPPRVVNVSQGSGPLYVLGTIGALVWFLGRARGPRGYALGVAKSFVWPALLVFGALRVLSSGEHSDVTPESAE